MKKSFLLFFAVFGFVTLSFAQEGMKAVKKAGRSLSTYNLDPTANADKLTESYDLIKKAFESDEVKSETKAYTVKGDVYSTIANSIITAAVLDPASATGKDMSLAYKAVDAYKKAYELAEKKFEKKDAIKGMIALESIIENLGIVAYQNKSWMDAYKSFKGAIELGDYINSIGETSRVNAEVKKDLMMNALSVGAQDTENIDLGPTIEEAVAMDIDDPVVYQIAYSTFAQTDKEKAVKYLNQGVSKFPEDSGLLFAQINYYIGEGQLDILIDKLKAAIKAEPDNASVYATLGNVYDQLYSKAVDEGNEEKAKEYFQGALDYYNQATEIDPKSFSSYYGIGALYFNKAAKVGKQLNELSSDFSAAGIKKYDAKKAEMNDLYEKSYPFLEKAEKLNDKDPLVIQALKEYYVRTSQMEKAEEYKAKLDEITGGSN